MAPVEKVEIGNATLYCGDCLGVLPILDGFECCVTSPPYDGVREYGGTDPVDCLAVIELLSRKVRGGGVVMWNVADQSVNGSETGSSFRQALHALESGFRLHDTMIYCREGVIYPHPGQYHQAFEYMFIWSKGRPATFNGIKDWRNKWAGDYRRGTTRQRGSDQLVPDPNRGKVYPSHSLRRNWWVLDNKPGSTGHPAPMPYAMAADHILSWTNPGDLVVDPFMGSGTTGVAAARLGRSFIGVEIHKPYFEYACRQIEAAQRQGDLLNSVGPA